MTYQNKKISGAKGDKDNMKVENREIEFTDYAPLDKEYTKKELAAVYKKIITDITKDKR